MAEQQRPRRLSVVTGLLLLTIRGILLWIVVPCSLVYWLIFWPVWRRKKVGLAQFLGWTDLNLIATIERTILGPFIPTPIPWTSAKELPTVTHRIRLTDPS